MDSTPRKLSSIDYFNQFVESPRDVSSEVLDGAHRYVARSIQEGKGGPTIKDLVKMFGHFTHGKVQAYVFKRTTKPILLELALRIIQEISLNGVGRAKSLQLVTVKSKAGGKIIRIADQFSNGEDDFDEAALQKIDEAYFRLLDKEGKSPEVNFAAGQDHAAPYSPFAKDGSFVRPKPMARRSLEASIEVWTAPCVLFHCGLVTSIHSL